MSKKPTTPIETPAASKENLASAEQPRQMLATPIPEYTSIDDAQGLIVKRARKTMLTRVVKMNHDFLCHTREGDLMGHSGDFLAFDAGGRAYPILASEFDAMYEVVTG